jgi:uncharacterized protein (DUF302 family)
MKGEKIMNTTKLNHLAKMFLFAMLFAGMSFQSSGLKAQESDLVTVKSKSSFDQTVEQLKQMVSQNGMMVLSELNQGKVLSMTGLQLNAISLFVGNPTIGKQLFSADRAVGVAIPVRVNIYENSDGKTYVSYVKPTQQLAPFKNENIQKIAKMLDEKLAKLTGMLS